MLRSIQDRLRHCGISQKKRSAWLTTILNDFLKMPNAFHMVQEEFITYSGNTTIGYSLSETAKQELDSFLVKYPSCDISQVLRTAISHELLFKTQGRIDMTKHIKPIAQLDLFVADILDISPKSDMTSMEHPIFSLSKKTDTETFRYEHPSRDAWIEVVPSTEGRATIFDKDLLLYCYGQIVEGLNRGRQVSRRLHIIPHEYFIATGKHAGGKQYRDLLATLSRLRGTTIKTNISSDNKSKQRGDVFGLIDEAKVIEEKGRATALEVTLSERIFDAISAQKVLAYSMDYFRITSAFERRMYELCRKHCGRQDEWSINLDNLYNKFGSKGSIREFRRKMKQMEEKQNIPDYVIHYMKNGRAEKILVINDEEGLIKAMPADVRFT